MAAGLAIELPRYDNATHAWLLIGVRGHSAAYETRKLAAALAPKQANIQIIVRADDKAGISIEQIRELYAATRAKSAERRVWIIEDSDHLSLEAQNAFLKLLEEPPAHVTFILSARDENRLLPTIRSRSRLFYCRPVQGVDTKIFLQHQGLTDAHTITQLIFLAEGSPTELMQLATNDVYRKKQLERAALAKQCISGPIFDKICIAHTLAGNRADALVVVGLALRMLLALAPGHASSPATVGQLRRFIEAYESIQQNGNVKLQLLRAWL